MIVLMCEYVCKYCMWTACEQSGQGPTSNCKGCNNGFLFLNTSLQHTDQSVLVLLYLLHVHMSVVYIVDACRGQELNHASCQTVIMWDYVEEKAHLKD